MKYVHCGIEFHKIKCEAEKVNCLSTLIVKPHKVFAAPTFQSTNLSKYDPKVNLSTLTRSKIKAQIWIL
jgi:hypothetical protein